MVWVSVILSIIGFLVQYGPQIASLMQEIWSHLKLIRDPSKQKAYAIELEAGVTEFKKSGDRRPLLALLQRVHDELCAQTP